MLLPPTPSPGCLLIQTFWPTHTWKSSQRPMENRSLCSVTCSHPGPLGDASGLESAPKDLPIPKNHLWGPWGPGICAQQPAVNQETSVTCSYPGALSEVCRGWEPTPSDLSILGSHVWGPQGPEVCSQWLAVIQEPSVRPAGTESLPPSHPLTHRNHIWSPWGLGVCAQWPAVIQEPRMRSTETRSLLPESWSNLGILSKVHRAMEGCTTAVTHPTWELCLRPTGIRNLCPAAHSHLRTHSEVLGDWKSAPSDTPTPRNYRWGNWEATPSKQATPGNHLWSPQARESGPRDSHPSSTLSETHCYMRCQGNKQLGLHILPVWRYI